MEVDDAITLSFLFKPWFEYPFYVPEIQYIGIVLMHSGNDLANAEQHSSVLEFYPTYLAFQSEFIIAKTKYTMEPTKKVPCVDLYPDACGDLKMNDFAKHKY